MELTFARDLILHLTRLFAPKIFSNWRGQPIGNALKTNPGQTTLILQLRSCVYTQPYMPRAQQGTRNSCRHL